MKRNEQTPRLLIVAEDKATSTIAQGFIGNYIACRQNRCKIIRHARGFKDAIGMAKSLRLDVQNQDYVVVVIDYDNQDSKRYEKLTRELASVPQHDRIFLLGSKDEAEKLLQSMKVHFNDTSLDLEGIGKRIAQECYDGHKPTAWETDSLDINYEVVWRLEKFVKPFLFNERIKDNDNIPHV